MRRARQFVTRGYAGLAFAHAPFARTASSSAPLLPHNDTGSALARHDTHAEVDSLQQHMREKGFANATPNFSMDFGSASDMQRIAADILTECATDVNLVRDLYGPWLVMTSDLQGELLIDKDNFVFYRPANGLGYGVGTIHLLSAGSVGTAFTMQLETYSYKQTDIVAPRAGTRLDVTGMVQKITSRSSDYTTFSLVGVWQRSAEMAGDTPQSRAPGAAADATSDTELAGQFNCAKIAPWSEETSAGARWTPNEELLRVFDEIFPQPLELNSHKQRAAAATAAHRAIALEATSKENHTKGGGGGGGGCLYRQGRGSGVGTGRRTRELVAVAGEELLQQQQ